VLASGRTLSLSKHTADALAAIAGTAFHKELLPVAVDTRLFTPAIGATVRGRLGFAGRFNDPRKNIGLLLQAVARLRGEGHDVSAVLMGDTPDAEMLRQVEAMGLAGYIVFQPGLSRETMRDWMQTLDVFVLPSHQEGLCIAALEAMACGVPVVSTRCGGPEEFVIPGVTGRLVAADAGEIAGAVAAIVEDAELRSAMSRAARALVEERYTHERVEAIFSRAFMASFPALGSRPADAAQHLVPAAATGSIG